jgi:soluble lytic murein transglycosylase
MSERPNSWPAPRAAGHEFGLSDIPYPETRNYVTRVLDARDDYASTYPKELGLGR